MTKKVLISLDLASMAGTLKYVPGPELPRHDKGLLERTIAATFLAHLSQHEGSTIADVQSNASDPADVTFKYNGQFRGIELSELIPQNRLEKDSIIRRLRRDIISRLTLGEKTGGKKTAMWELGKQLSTDDARAVRKRFFLQEPGAAVGAHEPASLVGGITVSPDWYIRGVTPHCRIRRW